MHTYLERYLASSNTVVCRTEEIDCEDLRFQSPVFTDHVAVLAGNNRLCLVSVTVLVNRNIITFVYSKHVDITSWSIKQQHVSGL